MIQINLLPWRAQARQIQKVQFIFLSIFFFILAILAIIVSHIYFSMQLSNQLHLNEYLQSEIDKEQLQLTNLSDKQKDKVQLETQMHYIINLYNQSYDAIRLMNELPPLVPESIFLDKIARNANLISLNGIAQSDYDVTLFKQNLDKSPFFSNPIVNQISSEKNSRQASFEINVTQDEEKEVKK